jgi:hypothetical protein
MPVGAPISGISFSGVWKNLAWRWENELKFVDHLAADGTSFFQIQI